MGKAFLAACVGFVVLVLAAWYAALMHGGDASGAMIVGAWIASNVAWAMWVAAQEEAHDG